MKRFIHSFIHFDSSFAVPGEFTSQFRNFDTENSTAALDNKRIIRQVSNVRWSCNCEETCRPRPSWSLLFILEQAWFGFRQFLPQHGSIHVRFPSPCELTASHSQIHTMQPSISSNFTFRRPVAILSFRMARNALWWTMLFIWT